MPEHFIVHEGRNGGIEERVLNAIVVQHYQLQCQARPAWGKENVRAVAQFLRGHGSAVATVIDRDFRTRADADASWQPGSSEFVWRRHEIENYLLDPRVLSKTIDGLSRADLAQTLVSASGPLDTLARRMLDDHAGNLAYEALLQRKLAEVDHRFQRPGEKRPPVRLSGSPYPTRDAWITYLTNEAERLRSDCRKFEHFQDFSDESVRRLFDEQLARCEQREFWNRRQFIEEMDGKALLSAILDWTNSQGIPISRADFEAELCGSLAADYQRGFFDPDDFAGLADAVANSA